jgi:hypothetical protein
MLATLLVTVLGLLAALVLGVLLDAPIRGPAGEMRL